LARLISDFLRARFILDVQWTFYPWSRLGYLSWNYFGLNLSLISHVIDQWLALSLISSEIDRSLFYYSWLDLSLVSSAIDQSLDLSLISYGIDLSLLYYSWQALSLISPAIDQWLYYLDLLWNRLILTLVFLSTPILDFWAKSMLDFSSNGLVARSILDFSWNRPILKLIFLSRPILDFWAKSILDFFWDRLIFDLLFLSRPILDYWTKSILDFSSDRSMARSILDFF